MFKKLIIPTIIATHIFGYSNITNMLNRQRIHYQFENKKVQQISKIVMKIYKKCAMDKTIPIEDCNAFLHTKMKALKKIDADITYKKRNQKFEKIKEEYARKKPTKYEIKMQKQLDKCLSKSHTKKETEKCLRDYAQKTRKHNGITK